MYPLRNLFLPAAISLIYPMNMAEKLVTLQFVEFLTDRPFDFLAASMVGPCLDLAAEDLRAKYAHFLNVSQVRLSSYNSCRNLDDDVDFQASRKYYSGSKDNIVM